MPDLKVCRICLAKDRKMYKYGRFHLKTYYEHIMGTKVKSKDCLPRYFCYECAVLLHKFHKFKEKCHVSRNALQDLNWKGSISYESVSNLAAELIQIKSSINIITVTERVKTYFYHDDTDIKSDSDNVSIKEEIGDEERIDETEVPYISEESIVSNDDCMPLVMDVDDKDNKKINALGTCVLTENKEDKLDNLNKNPKVDLAIASCEGKQDLEVNNDIVEQESLKEIFVASILKAALKRKSLKKKKKKIYKKTSKQKKRTKCKDVDFEPDNFAEYGLKERNPAFAKKRKRFLNMNHWKKSTLSEEEAILDLKKKAEDPKYIAAEFKCTDCVKWFREADILKRHRQLRHSEAAGTMQCRFCNMRFKWDCHLRKHLRSHFTKYECQRCNLVCPLETTALLHEDYHNGVIKKCKHCGIEFKHSSTYYTHLRTHRSEYLCTLCGMSFVSPLGLVMHKRVKHVTDEVEVQDDGAESSTYCERCDIRFETQKAYEEHVFQSALHTDGVEFDDILNDSSVAATIPEPDDDDKPLSKLSSFKKLSRKRKRPLKIVHRKPTTCHQCGKHFATQTDCMKHHLAEHRGTSFYPPTEKQICEICGTLLAPGSVAMHLNTHTRERMHACDTCGRQFNTAVSLKRHQVTHTGEKNFPCPLCEKRFTQSNSMKLHYRTYHLKEPYPKRNRRKKDMTRDRADGPDSDSEEECNRKTIRLLTPIRRDNMLYMTLN